MNAIPSISPARTVATQFVESNGRRLAYRRFGNGPALVLCVRFRGIMDVWDPQFLDALAENFTVIIFEYSGLGQSTGNASYQKIDMAYDVNDLVDGLGLEKVVVGGWSLGGFAAMVFAAMHPEKVSHVLAIGTMPPGVPVRPMEKLFLETALKDSYSVSDEHILFFEPNAALSRTKADESLARIAARTGDRSPPIAKETYLRILSEATDPTSPFPDPDGRYDAFFRNTEIPVLALSGDHDIVFPVESWYALNDIWPTLYVVTYPQAGHGPQHQLPRMSADIIATFVRNT